VEYFSRQIMLWGEDTQKNLQSKKVLVVGSGGLGCSVAMALSGSGVGQIDIVDFDKVEFHNIHRQILFDLQDIGEFKAKVAVNKIKNRAANLQANAFTCAFKDLKDFNYDLIIDATDNLEVRKQIDEIAKKYNIAWVYGSVEEFNGQVCLFKESSFDMFALKEIEAKGITAPMVMQIASFEANLALRYLADLPVGADILYYLYFNKNGEFEVKKFKLPKEKK